jgi:hypothetical protein
MALWVEAETKATKATRQLQIVQEVEALQITFLHESVGQSFTIETRARAWFKRIQSFQSPRLKLQKIYWSPYLFNY